MKVIVVAPLADDAIIVDRSRVWEAAYGAAFAGAVERYSTVYFQPPMTATAMAQCVAEQVAMAAVESLDKL